MSGHSKWATIKRAKESKDAKRGNIFTKLGNAITVAARTGGDPDSNFALRVEIDKAKSANMPKDNIERAIKRGTGELEGAQIEELTYEGFGPAKAGFIIEVVTDSKNRSAAEIRHIFTKHGGSLGATNSVSWNFNHLGIIRVLKENLPSETDELELELIDAGVDDMKKELEGWTLYTAIENLQKVQTLLDAKNIKAESIGIEYIAKDEKNISEEEKSRVENFINALEESDDINNYYTDVNL